MELITNMGQMYIVELNTLERPMTGGGSGGGAGIEEDIGAPSHYSGTGEKVNLNTGALVYETVDYVLPGVNGLDLVIGRRYDLNKATLFLPELITITIS
jgi:hypothetical protein